MKTISIYRPGSPDLPFVTIKPDDSSSQTKKVMGENQLNITFVDSRNIVFKINDYCTVYGEKYTINKLPVITKVSKFEHRYTLIMEAPSFDLLKYQYLFLGADNLLRETDFSLMGNADTFIDLLIANANRVSSGWTKGQVIPTAYKNLSFNLDNCYSALARIAEAFQTEFSIEGKKVHLTKRLNDTGYTFKHGRNKGLYEITRQNLSDADLVTRLYAYGSDKNLPPDYITTGKRLRFPGGFNPCLISFLTCTIVNNGDGTQTFTFNWTAPISPGVTGVTIEARPLTSDIWTTQTGSPTSPRSITVPAVNHEFRFRTIGPTCAGITTPIVTITADIVSPIFVFSPLPYIERNVPLYGVIEHTQIFEDIYPHRTGTVTSVNIADIYEFSDTDIDFNVNDMLLPGLVAKVTFNTGQLAGYSFELESFNNTFKRFRIQKNTDERVLEIPSALLRPAIGDTYVLTDIRMPDSYVTEAENKLLEAANALLVQLSEPQLAYTVVIDPVFVRRYNRLITIGDLVWIVDDELEVQRKIRVVSMTRGIVDEYELQVELSDIVSPGTVSRIVSAQLSTERDVQDINGQFINNGILNNRVAGTLSFSNMPTVSDTTGFQQVYIELSTGKLYRKV